MGFQNRGPLLDNHLLASLSTDNELKMDKGKLMLARKKWRKNKEFKMLYDKCLSRIYLCIISHGKYSLLIVGESVLSVITVYKGAYA